jgi:predicted enzyme related to lactoylglutathione lyase
MNTDTNNEAKMRNVVASSAVRGARKPGELCWFNMITPDPRDACDFFAALLGWTYVEAPGIPGYMVQVDGRNVGGLWDQNGPTTPKGTPAAIGIAIKVDSADEISERAKRIGGTARPPMDVYDAGRMAVITDPTGAQFDVWQPKRHDGTDVDNRVVGAPAWIESRTRDVARASAFYAELFGWTPEVMTPPGMTYTTFRRGTTYVGGMVQCPPEMKVEPHWAIFFNSDDVDGAAKKAAALGATVCMQPTDIPNIGRFCALASPQGVALQLIKYVRV